MPMGFGILSAAIVAIAFSFQSETTSADRGSILNRSVNSKMATLTHTRIVFALILYVLFYSAGGPTLINVLPNFSVRQLPDHPIRSRQHIRRNDEADLLGGFQVDDQLEIVWLLDR